MIEFFGAFLGALIGVFIPVGICMYRINKDLEKTFKDLVSIASFESTIQMDVKHED